MNLSLTNQTTTMEPKPAIFRESGGKWAGMVLVDETIDDMRTVQFQVLFEHRESLFGTLEPYQIINVSVKTGYELTAGWSVEYT